jgi:hypothetical protein
VHLGALLRIDSLRRPLMGWLGRDAALKELQLCPPAQGLFQLTNPRNCCAVCARGGEGERRLSWRATSTTIVAGVVSSISRMSNGSGFMLRDAARCCFGDPAMSGMTGSSIHCLLLCTGNFKLTVIHRIETFMALFHLI